MEFVCYTAWDELPESANALFETAGKKSIFFSKLWFENLLKTGLSKDETTLLACVIDKDEVLAVLPLSPRDGENYQSLKHLYTSLSTLLLGESRRDEILACLVEGLRQLPARSLQLDPIAEDDTNLDRLQLALESSGYACHRYFRFHNWIHKTRGESYSDYMAARPSRVRNTIARKKRKLEREHGYQVRLFTGDNLQQGLTDYNAVYTASWKANEVFEGFIKGLAEHLSKPGWLRLAILYVENKPVAAQFWFVAHGKASIFKLAYDEAWKQYSPGSILIAYLMEYVIDTDKVEEIDFLTGDDAYKQDWMSERRQRWRMSCIDNSPSRGRDTNLLTATWGVLKRLKEKVYN
ncbi:GNAT family N-acetyltransferase [Solemya velesiana gill symbiont]|uniref:GNAT family N-acetyltransferase n=1 Tax=Solemya velesiana gill symbiont TaxID=1918948 RepID=A0A1T2KS65_9GAMM|nr:GNAT family N-acetyltransferase [Solemya velesiana gill symbiont]OOZ35697.1 GNAT family N-acetyltransferase [Solemya velesiana gill symbiont]